MRAGSVATSSQERSILSNASRWEINGGEGNKGKKFEPASERSRSKKFSAPRRGCLKGGVEAFTVTAATDGSPISLNEQIQTDPYTTFDEYGSMDYDSPLVDSPSAPTQIPTGVVIKAPLAGATLPLAQLSKPKSKGKGKVVQAPEEPKRKWLDEMTPAERAKLSQKEKELLSYQEGRYLKKKLATKAQAQHKTLADIGGSSATGMTCLLFFFLFFIFLLLMCSLENLITLSVVTSLSGMASYHFEK